MWHAVYAVLKSALTTRSLGCLQVKEDGTPRRFPPQYEPASIETFADRLQNLIRAPPKVDGSLELVYGIMADSDPKNLSRKQYKADFFLKLSSKATDACQATEPMSSDWENARPDCPEPTQGGSATTALVHESPKDHMEVLVSS